MIRIPIISPLNKVREGRRVADFPKLGVFLDYTAIYEHVGMLYIKAEYHSYLLVSE